MTSIQNMLESGLALIPIPLGKKGPVKKGWNLKTGCIQNTRQAHLLQGLNTGLAHAYCEPTPTCAIDIDHYPSAKKWLIQRGVELNSLLKDPRAVVIWSGKRYSLKLLYRLPPEQSALETKQIIDSDGRSTLEFRCATKSGLTVQDVLPPSIHPNGSSYKWIGAGDPCSLPEIPLTLLEVWVSLTRIQDKVGKSASEALRVPEETPRQIAKVRDMLKHINAYCSYESWRNILWSVLSTEWSCAEELVREWSKTAPDLFDEKTFMMVINSYDPLRSCSLTLATTYFYARQGGWNG